jgi:hypothetical protein
MGRAVADNEGVAVTILNPVIAAAMAVEVATIEREAPVPAAPFGYGRDLSCVSDCTANFDEVDPNSQLALAQSLLRRLDTVPGSVADDPDNGFDLVTTLHRPVTLVDIQGYAERIRAEWRKDDRVDDAEVTITPSADLTTLDCAAQVTAIDPTIGTFTFTFAVTEDGAELLESIV